MPNVMQILKAEITRLARKEAKAQVDPLAAKLAEQRRAIATLRKKKDALAKQVAGLKGRVKSDEIISADDVAEQDVAKARINSRRIAGLRRKLGLSRNQMAMLLGVNANTIYLWEQGKTRPRAAAKAKIIQLRTIGRRAANRLVKAARAEGKPASKPKAGKGNKRKAAAK